jgi:hypothetical protein
MTTRIERTKEENKGQLDRIAAEDAKRPIAYELNAQLQIACPGEQLTNSRDSKLAVKKTNKSRHLSASWLAGFGWRPPWRQNELSRLPASNVKTNTTIEDNRFLLPFF